ncbi:MAG: SAVED domain-containing protein [Anaerolineae bacterium]|nr:SAVED domain-containing protein [Anaerolineae bacterium]
MSEHFIFPKPSDWNTFEDIVCDVYSRKLGNYNLQRYGRSGQSQNGIDIAGITSDGLLGIQCKHHPTGNISISEIDSEINKSEGFHPELSTFIIATSADRDVNAHSHVLEISEGRIVQGKFPVTIKFWQDIYSWLAEFPDLVYKHFTKYFPLGEQEEIRFPELGKRSNTTLHWPVSLEQLKASTTSSIGTIEKVESYRLTMEFTTFPGTRRDNVVDLVVSLYDLFNDETSVENNFLLAAKILNDIRIVVSESYFSSELWVYLQARLTAAFLFGWIFRRVTNFDLRLVMRDDQIWATNGLPLVPSRICEGLPILCSSESAEVVLVLNISRNIDTSVQQFISNWNNQPRAILSYRLEGGRVSSAAHALSIALEVSNRIKTLIDVWEARKIHLFGTMPAALATLISYHLNAICPISVYFCDSSRTTYSLGGTLTNNL